MTTPSDKGKALEPAKPIGPAKPRPKLSAAKNRNSIGVRPHKYVNPTKAEMYEDLRKAVENTK